MVRATQVDTVLHTHLEVDSTRTSSRRLHEVNVIGTMNLLAAAAAEGSAVRKIILKASTLIYGSNFADPYFFRETQRRTHPPTTPVERSLVEVDALVGDFADDHPEVAVTSLRFANVLGDDVTTVFSRMLRMPAVPEVFGYDPRLQFVHEDDVTRALAHASVSDVAGTFNVAGPGTITWSEACRARGAPPVGDAAGVHRCGEVAVAAPARDRHPARGAEPAALRARRRHRARSSTPGSSTATPRRRRSTRSREGARLERVVGTPPEYEYERDVEDFLRNSRAVVQPRGLS